MMARRKNSSDFLLWVILAVVGATLGSAVTAGVYTVAFERESVSQSRAFDDYKRRSAAELSLIKQQLNAVNRGDTAGELAAINEQLQVLTDENARLTAENSGLRNSTRRNDATLIETIKAGAGSVGRAIAGPSEAPVIIQAATIPGFSPSSSHPFAWLFVGMVIENTTPEAVKRIEFYVQMKSRNRTVPHGDKVVAVSIPGGIEPGERKELQINLRLDEMNISGEMPPETLPEGTDFRIAVVGQKVEKEGELYEIYSDLMFTPAPYTWVKRTDPAMDWIIGR